VVLQLKGLQRAFGQMVAVDGVNLEIPDAQTVALIGKAPGSGRSTLIDLISGHLRPDSGEIIFCGEDITALLPKQRADMGLVCSFPETNLFDELTIADHVLAVARNSGSTSNMLYSQWKSDSQYLKKAIKTLAEIGLHIGMDTPIHQLSALQKKLLGLGLATLNPFTMLLWENPVEGLESSGIEEITSSIREFERKGSAILFTANDTRFIEQTADRQLLMDSGQIVADH